MTLRVVGVDAGATRTRAVVVDEGLEVLGRADGPPGVIDPREPATAAEVIAEVVRRAVLDARSGPPLDALWAGVAGAGREAPRSAVEALLADEGLAAAVRVGADVEVAFEEAFPDGPGILLVAGTGSIAQGRGERGETARVGGWGTLLGDEGSGYAVGLEALRAVVRASDGRGERTELEDSVLRRLALAEVDDLVGWAAGASKAEVASLVPVVAEAARGGDMVSDAILTRAAAELDRLVQPLVERLGPWTTPPEVALAGGLLGPEGPLRARMERVLAAHGLPFLEPTLEPVRGAARLALALARDAHE